MIYRLLYLQSVVDEDILKLTKSVRARVKKAIEEKLATHPIESGKPLRYSLKGARRLRVGDWRVIYRIEPPDVVVVLKIGHRREIYQGWVDRKVEDSGLPRARARVCPPARRFV